MIRCNKIRPTGGVAKDGSLFIDCRESLSGTTRTCGPDCPGFTPRERTSGDYEQSIRDVYQARIDAALNGGCCGG